MLRESPVVVAAVAEAVGVGEAADHAVGKGQRVASLPAARSPHFFELRDNVHRCRIVSL